VRFVRVLDRRKGILPIHLARRKVLTCGRATFNPPGEAFVVTEKNGVWGRAGEVPGTAKLNSGGEADVFAMSCTRDGQCAAGGDYEAGQQRFQAFVVSRR
jgi:hypothetical protein